MTSASDRIPGFADPPAAGDAVLFGLDRRGARLRCAAAAGLRPSPAVGVDPTEPAAGLGGLDRARAGGPATVERDTTGGLNRAGEVVLHVPARAHRVACWPGGAPAGCAAGWCEPAPGSRSSTLPPRLRSATARHHRRHGRRRPRRDDRGGDAGPLRGGAGPAVRASRAPPIVAPRTPRWRSRSPAATAGRAGRRSASFADSGPQDRHFIVDRSAGEVAFGPAVRPARRHAAPVRRGAAEGRGDPRAPVPHRRRAAGQRGRAAR